MPIKIPKELDEKFKEKMKKFNKDFKERRDKADKKFKDYIKNKK